MPDYAALKAEIAADPAGLGYAGKTDPEIIALLTDPTKRTITRRRTNVQGREVLAALNAGELGALTAIQVQRLALVTGATGGINPEDPNVRAIFGDLFPQNQRPTSRAALLALQTETVTMSRAQELGWVPPPVATDLAEMRRLLP